MKGESKKVGEGRRRREEVEKVARRREVGVEEDTEEGREGEREGSQA